MVRIKASRMWPKCANTEAIVLRFPRSKMSLVYILFRVSTQSSLSHLPPTRWTWTHRLFSMLPTPLTRHFRWGNTCVLFTLGNSCVSCYATHTTYSEFPLEHLCPVYFRQQAHILLYHQLNLCVMLRESFQLVFNTRTEPFI